MSTVTTTPSSVSALLRMIRYAAPFAKPLALAFVLLLTGTVLEMLSPWLMKIILDDYIAVGISDMPVLLRMGGLLFATYLGSSILQYLQSVLFQETALKIVHNIRNELFAHVLTLPIRYFDNEPTGRLVSRITHDSEVIRQMYVSVMPVMIQAVLRVIGIFIAMALLSLKLMLITLLVIPVMLLAVKLYHKVSNPVIHGVRNELANINARINESLRGMRIVQAMGQEQAQQDQFEQNNTTWSLMKRKTVGIDSLLLMPFTNLLNALILAIVVGWFGYQSNYSVVEVGTLYAFINYLGRFFDPFRQITVQMSSLQQALVASERVFQLLDEKTTSIRTTADAQSPDLTQGKVSFENVSLSYDGKHQALKDVSFTVESGQFVAIVGHSGSGKSSVINLLMGFYGHQQGDVLIDGHPIEQFAPDTLRKGFGLVFQEPYIFNGSIAENISLNNPNITQDDVEAAARKVHADRFIRALDGGYEHNSGSEGKALSTGERQLLSFARTIAQNPKILLLDEATANIDGATEHRIKEALITLRENRTTIAVAHRLSTIQDADLILVMDQGRITQQGRHEELLQEEGHYRDLYLAQQAEELLTHA